MRITVRLLLLNLILGGVILKTHGIEDEQPTMATDEGDKPSGDVATPTVTIAAATSKPDVVPVVDEDELVAIDDDFKTGDNANSLPHAADTGKKMAASQPEVDAGSQGQADVVDGSGVPETEDTPRAEEMQPVDEPLIVAVISEPTGKLLPGSGEVESSGKQEELYDSNEVPFSFEIGMIDYDQIEDDGVIVSFVMNRSIVNELFYKYNKITEHVIIEVKTCSNLDLGNNDIVNVVCFESEQEDSKYITRNLLINNLKLIAKMVSNDKIIFDLKEGYVSPFSNYDVPLMINETEESTYRDSVVVLHINNNRDSLSVKDVVIAINTSLSAVGELRFFKPIIQCGSSPIVRLLLKVGDRYLSPLEIKNILDKEGVSDISSIFRANRLDAVEYNDLSPSQKDNIVTVELEPLGNDVAIDTTHEYQYNVINGLLVAEGVPGHMVYVKPEPTNTRHNKIHISFFVTNKKTAYHAVSSDALIGVLTSEKLKEFYLRVTNIFKGMPTYMFPNVNIRDLTGMQQSTVVSLIFKIQDGGSADSATVGRVVKQVNSDLLQVLYSERKLSNIDGSGNSGENEQLNFISPTPLTDNDNIHLTFFIDNILAVDLMRPDVLNNSGNVVAMKYGELGGQIHVYSKYEELTNGEKLGLCTIVMKEKPTSQGSDMMVMGNKLYDFVVTRRNLTADLGQIRTPSGDYVLYRVFTTLTGVVEDAHKLRREISTIFKNDFEDDEYSFVKIYVGMNDTLNPKDYNTVPYDELSSDDLNTVYTAVYQARGMDEIDMLHRRDSFTGSFIRELNIVSRSYFISDHVDPNSQRSKRNTDLEDENDYKNEDMKFVKPSPQLYNNSIEMAFFVKNNNGKYPSEKEIITVLESMADDKPFLYVKGMSPNYIPVTITTTSAPVVYSQLGSGWDDHRFLFIALLILALVCFVVLVIGLACIRYRTSRGSWSRADDEAKLGETGDEYPLSAENPITDEEIMKSEAMVDNEAPKIDQDNGWMVPLEQGKNTQENTKL